MQSLALRTAASSATAAATAAASGSGASGGVPRDRARLLGPAQHLDAEVLHGLERPDRAAELLTLLRVRRPRCSGTTRRPRSPRRPSASPRDRSGPRRPRRDRSPPPIPASGTGRRRRARATVTWSARTSIQVSVWTSRCVASAAPTTCPVGEPEAEHTLAAGEQDARERRGQHRTWHEVLGGRLQHHREVDDTPALAHHVEETDADEVTPTRPSPLLPRCPAGRDVRRSWRSACGLLQDMKKFIERVLIPATDHAWENGRVR